MNKGWECPNCGKAHGPHVDTCPNAPIVPPSIPPVWPRRYYEWNQYPTDPPWTTYFYPVTLSGKDVT